VLDAFDRYEEGDDCVRRITVRTGGVLYLAHGLVEGLDLDREIVKERLMILRPSHYLCESEAHAARRLGDGHQRCVPILE